MTIEEVINYYGSIKTLADSIGVSRQTIYLWKEKGAIPFARQAQIELESDGHLKTTRGKRARK